MSEIFWNHNEYIDWIDVKGDKTPDWFNENQIKDKARKYVESRVREWANKQDIDELLRNIKQLLEKQDVERLNLIEELKQRENNDTKENIDKEAMINEAKIMLYEKLWISDNQKNNSKIENFLKWIVDELVIWNYELAIEIYNTNWKVIIESLKQLASWEWIKKLAESLWESIWNLFDLDAYEKWKSVAQLWLLTTGVWLWVAVWKKWLKLWARELSKLRKPAERVVESPEIRNVVWVTRWKVDEIVPKKQMDFDKMLVEDIARLGDKERLEAWSFYLKWKKFTSEQEKAILEAHNIWKDRKWAWIYNYTKEEIKQKAEILKQAGFSLEERRILLEKWVCWNESTYSIGNRLKPEQRERLEKLSLPENIINLDLELWNLTEKQLSWLGERLWLPINASIKDIELTYKLKLKKALERYGELTNSNMNSFNIEIQELLKKSWDNNPLKTLEDEILKLEVMKDRWDLIIVSVVSKNTKDKWFQLSKFSSIDENWSKKWEVNYLNLRKNTEQWMWVYWLDPKYASFLISKWQLDNIKIYWWDNPKYIWYTINELEWRAWVSLYDSMLSWQLWWHWTTKQMLEFTNETLINAKAIYNIDERLGFPIHNRLKQQAILANNWKMSWFFNWINPYVEVHIYWWNSKKVQEALSEQDFVNKYFNK